MILAPGFAPTCPDCGDIAHPSATVCDACGTHLLVAPATGRPFTVEGPHGCTSTACVLDLYDNGLPL